MKKTYNINLSGQIFCIDDDAFLKLQTYIDTLEKHYLKEEGGKEIMADIENRIAELLQELLRKNYRQVVSISDIDQIIQIMGTPDCIIEEDTESPDTSIKRKLYRDTNESILGGVASGMAAYFNIPVVWIRLAFILLTLLYGMTIIAYIILWIITPAATTSRQRMEMKGEKINVSNIEKNIRNTYQEFKTSRLQNFSGKINKNLQRFFQWLRNILQLLLKVVWFVLAIFGLLGGSCIFLTISGCLLFPEHITNFTLYHALNSAIPSGLLIGSRIILFFILCIPALLIVYISARYLFHFAWNRIFLLSMIGCWFLAGFIGIFIALQQTLKYADVSQNSTQHSLVACDTSLHKYTVHFESLSSFDRQGKLIRSNRSFSNILAFDSLPPKRMYLKANMHVISSFQNSPSLNIQKKVRGNYNSNKFNYLNDIDYHWKQDGNNLFLDTYFKLQHPTWKGQEVQVTLSIPEGDTLIIHGNNYYYHMEIPFEKYQKVYKTVMKNGQLEVIN